MDKDRCQVGLPSDYVGIEVLEVPTLKEIETAERVLKFVGTTVHGADHRKIIGTMKETTNVLRFMLGQQVLNLER